MKTTLSTLVFLFLVASTAMSAMAAAQTAAAPATVSTGGGASPSTCESAPASTSSSTGPKQPRIKDWYQHPTQPNVALSSNSDGSTTAKANLTFQWDHIAEAYRGDAFTPVWGWAIAPTFSATDNTKKGLFSVGQSGTPSFGETSFSVGLMGAFTRYSSLRTEELDALFTALDGSQNPTNADINRCINLCASRPNDSTNNCKAFMCSVSIMAPDTASYTDAQLSTIAKNIDRGALCSLVQTDVDQRFNALLAKNKNVQAASDLEKQRARFPVVDVSLWGGGGVSQFAYYAQQQAATDSSAATYASTTQWKPNSGAALALNAVPWIDGRQPHGWTLEALAYLRASYLNATATGMGCSSPLGTVTSDKFPGGSQLAQCGTNQPIGAPSFGSDLVAEAYLGWADIDKEYGRIAIGGGLEQNFVNSITTYSIKVPIYLNGTAPAKGDTAPKASPDSIQAISYDGIVRLIPTVSYTLDPSGKTTGWTAGVSVDLIGNHNLFTRADNLVK